MVAAGCASNGCHMFRCCSSCDSSRHLQILLQQTAASYSLALVLFSVMNDIGVFLLYHMLYQFEVVVDF